MAIRVALNHVTHYSYDRPVQLAPHVVRLRPAPHSRTPITAYSIRVTPEDHFLNWQQDPFGNWQARLVFPKLARELKRRDRPGRGPDDHQPVRLLPRGVRRTRTRSSTRRRWRTSCAPYLEAVETGARFGALVDRGKDDIVRPERRSSTSWSTSTS